MNEGPIVTALRAVGATVSRLNEAGAPDLLVGFRGRTFLLEVKRPLGARGGMPERRNHEGGKGDMTEAQVRWWETWRGSAPTVVRSVDEALAAIAGRAEHTLQQIGEATHITRERGPRERALPARFDLSGARRKNIVL